MCSDTIEFISLIVLLFLIQGHYVKLRAVFIAMSVCFFFSCKTQSVLIIIFEGIWYLISGVSKIPNILS